MILYHFTANENLDSILEQGLTKGEVPLSATEVINGVWLTTDADPSGHGLSDRRQLSEEELRALSVMNGGAPASGPVYTRNKRAVRIEVKIPSTDRHLAHWPKWGKKRLALQWFEALNKAGGNKHRTWYIYFGTIPAEDFRSVEKLQ